MLKQIAHLRVNHKLAIKQRDGPRPKLFFAKQIRITGGQRSLIFVGILVLALGLGACGREADLAPTVSPSPTTPPAQTNIPETPIPTPEPTLIPTQRPDSSATPFPILTIATLTPTPTSAPRDRFGFISSLFGSGLPHYVHKEQGGAVRIDVDEASGGSAQIGERPNSIVARYDDTEAKFEILAFSEEGMATESLGDPPLKLSPVLTPGDGIADIFSAVWVDHETQELHIVLFLDTDWQEVVGDELFVHLQYWHLQDFTMQERREPFDFSDATDGVYVHKFAFENYFRALSSAGINGPVIAVAVTNMEGTPFEVYRKAGRLELEEQDVYVMLGGLIR